MELPKLLYLGLAFVTLGFVAPALEADPAPDIAVPVTADAVNDQFFAFDFQVIAICNWNDRIFKGNFHALGGTYSVEFKPNAAVTVGIPHRGVLTMTLDKPNSWINFNYGDCGWGMGMQKPCGWCTPAKYSSGQLNCGLNPRSARTFATSCHIYLGPYAAKRLAAPEPISEASEMQQATTVSSHHAPIATPGAIVVAADEPNAPDPTATVTAIPRIIKVTPTVKGGPIETILPFHIQVTESCDRNGDKKVKGRYTNGNLFLELNLAPGLIYDVDHHVSGFPYFSLGPFDYSASRLEFAYAIGPNSCVWFDDQTWQFCGECRAGVWSGPRLDCAVGGVRTREMDCSFILDVTHDVLKSDVEERGAVPLA